MGNNMIYKLRIMILESYVRITMIGYESKQNALIDNSMIAGIFDWYEDERRGIT